MSKVQPSAATQPSKEASFEDKLVSAFQDASNAGKVEEIKEGELPGPKSKKRFDDFNKVAEEGGSSAERFKFGNQDWFVVTLDEGDEEGKHYFYSKNDVLTAQSDWSADADAP